VVHTDRLQTEYEIEVRWLAFPLHPEVPEEGLSLEELFAGRGVNISDSLQHLKRVASSLSLPLTDRTRTYNSRLAQELAKWAESQGKEDEFHHTIFRAYFVDGKNIGRIDELVTLAASIGLPANEARDVILARRFREAVDSDWVQSHALGVTAVPTFIVGDQRIVGFQSYQVLEQFVIDSGARAKQG
jgi:predicted DsbA family dithiol-disulfide isomerase